MSEVKYVKLFPLKLAGGEYELVYPKITYGKSGQKVLFVSDSLTKEEAISGKYFSGSMGETISNTFDLAIKTGKINPKSIFITTTHVAKKSLALTDKERTDNQRKIFARLVRIIGKYKPNTVMIAGLKELLLWQQFAKMKFRKEYKILNQPQFRDDWVKLHGRLVPVSFRGYKCNVLFTFSPQHVASSNPKQFATSVQLLGFTYRDFETAIRGTNLYTLPAAKPKINIIKTIKEFDKFFEELKRAKTPSIDTECKNLNRVYGNSLLCILFSLDGKSLYTVPFHHSQTPFTPTELDYIKKKLKWFFEYSDKGIHIYHNAKFDLLILFAHLGLQYYQAKLFDTMNGEFSLDENKKFFRNAGISSSYTLDLLACEKGGLDYFTTEIKKVDRANMASYSLEAISQYGALDVIYPYHISRFQIQEYKRRGEAYAGSFKFVTELGSDIIKVFVTMEKNGLFTDLKYLTKLKAPNSELTQKLIASKNKFKENKATVKANDILLKKVGVPSTGKGIFGNGSDSWIFDINKPKHQHALYYDVLKLQPLEFRKDGGGKINKAFLREYGDTIKEVEMLKEFRGLEKLRNTYVEGIFKKLMEDDDGSIDYRLRAFYTWIQILTGRSGCSGPNLQAIPSHGALAKIIKRMFIASFDNIMIKADYSANEIRGWCNISKDTTIANPFLEGMYLRRKLRILRGKNLELDQDLLEWLQDNDWFNKKTTFDEKKKAAKKLGNRKELKEAVDILLELEVKGDPHKKNYEFFFGVPAEDVTPEQRQSVKQTIFGVLFEKAAFSLMKDVYEKEIKPILRKFLPKLQELDENSDEYDQMRYKMNTELKPFKDKAQNLIDTLYKTFETGGKWIRATQASAKESLHAISPFHAVRHLWGYMHHDQAAQAMMHRRGPNCVDMKTQCLTKTGWKYVSDLKVGNYIYTKNIATGKLELQPIQKLTIAKYKGKMWRLNGSIDALVTPNHRWLIDYTRKRQGKKYKNPEMVTSEFIANSGNNNPIHLTADTPHEQIGGKWTNDEVRLIGWVVTDGYFVKGSKKPSGIGRFNTRRLGVTQSIRGNPHKVKKIDKLFNRLNIKTSRSGPDNSHKITWRFYGELGDKIRKNLPNKIITPKFLTELSTKQLNILYETMLLGNGSRDNNLNCYATFGAGTKKKADAFAMLCTLLGVSCRVINVAPKVAKFQYNSMTNIPNQTQKFWMVYIKKLNRAQAMFYNSWQDYNGKVWCPTVKNETFIAKRKGSIYITGNSLIQGSSSNLGFEGAKQMIDICWELTKRKIDLNYKHCNFVHDSVETEAKISMIPLTLYYLEHSLTTQAHKRARETYDFNMILGLEIDVEIGGSLYRTQKWDYTTASLLRIMGEEIDWLIEELEYKLDKKHLMKCIKHNQALVLPYRLRELEKQGTSINPPEKMTLTPEIASTFNWMT